jgi:hypothetical protein
MARSMTDRYPSLSVECRQNDSSPSSLCLNKMRHNNGTAIRGAYFAAKTSQASSCAAFKALTTSNARGGGIGVSLKPFTGMAPLITAVDGGGEFCANDADSRGPSFRA